MIIITSLLLLSSSYSQLFSNLTKSQFSKELNFLSSFFPTSTSSLKPLVINKNTDKFKSLPSETLFQFTPQTTNNQFGLPDFELKNIYKDNTLLNTTKQEIYKNDSTYLYSLINDSFKCDLFSSSAGYSKNTVPDDAVFKKVLVFEEFNIALLDNGSLVNVVTFENDLVFETNLIFDKDFNSADDIFLLKNEEKALLVVYNVPLNKLLFYRINVKNGIICFNYSFEIDCLVLLGTYKKVLDVQSLNYIFVLTQEFGIAILRDYHYKDIFSTVHQIKLEIIESISGSFLQKTSNIRDFALSDRFCFIVTAHGLVIYDVENNFRLSSSVSSTNFSSITTVVDQIEKQIFVIITTFNITERLIEFKFDSLKGVEVNRIFLDGENKVHSKLLIDGLFGYLLKPEGSQIFAFRLGLSSEIPINTVVVNVNEYITDADFNYVYGRKSKRKEILLRKTDKKLVKISDFALQPQRLACIFTESGIFKFEYLGFSQFCFDRSIQEKCSLTINDELVVVSKYFVDFRVIYGLLFGAIGAIVSVLVWFLKFGKKVTAKEYGVEDIIID